MEWTQVLTILAAMGGMFAWNRNEARADNRRALDLMTSMDKEMKDFHGRLCSIEAHRHGISLGDIKKYLKSEEN